MRREIGDVQGDRRSSWKYPIELKMKIAKLEEESVYAKL